MGVKIASIDWYDGKNGFVSADSPALAICYTNGRCQIMKNESDESRFFVDVFYLVFLLKFEFILEPIVLDCEMEIICAQWNHDGSILAIGGIQTLDDKESNIIQYRENSFIII